MVLVKEFYIIRFIVLENIVSMYSFTNQLKAIKCRLLERPIVEERLPFELLSDINFLLIYTSFTKIYEVDFE